MRPFPNLMFFQFFLFCLYLRKFVSDLIIYLQRIRLQNLKQIFPEILRTFYFARCVQTSLKVASVTFGLVFMKSKKLRDFNQENEKLDLQVYFLVTQVFSLFKLFPILSYFFGNYFQITIPNF